jgi:hypothetical protein
MSVRIRYRIEASVSSTSAEEKDLGNVVYEVVNDESGDGGVRKTLLAGGATDVSIKLNQVTTAKFVLIRTNAKDPTDTLGPIDIKKNAIGGEVTTIEPLPGATEAHMLLVTSGITDLFATNSGSIDTEVTVMAVGD